MPELPEAEIAADHIRNGTMGALVCKCWVGRPDIIREGYGTLSWYEASRITAVTRHGKSVVLTFSKNRENRFLVAELGMTGLLLFQAARVRYPQHTHFVMGLAECREPELRYWNPRRFGRLYLLDVSGLERYVNRRFGYEPLQMSGHEFLRLIIGSRSCLKTLLMRQQKIAGIGNIYANEILFRAGLHPGRMASTLRPDDIGRLYHVMQTVLLEAVQFGGSSVRDFFAPDGSPGTYKFYHRVYGKSGEPCPNGCGTSLCRLVEERSSFICPTCQPRMRMRRRHP